MIDSSVTEIINAFNNLLINLSDYFSSLFWKDLLLLPRLQNFTATWSFFLCYKRIINYYFSREVQSHYFYLYFKYKDNKVSESTN